MIKFFFNVGTFFKRKLYFFLAHQRLNKTIELTRVCLFSIITQYRAIFNDDEHNIINTDRKFNENVIFYSWLHDKVIIKNN